MTMTKSHFEALARALRDNRPPDTEPGSVLTGFKPRAYQWALDVERIADVCAVSNVAFRRGQFYDACGYTAAYGRA